MLILADSNIWMALTFESHSHHLTAKQWFESPDEERKLFFCRMTEMSYLRLMTTKAVTGEIEITNAQALENLHTLKSDDRVGWKEEPEGIERKWCELAGLKTPSPKVWMDSYLAAFAILSGLQLASFDAGFRQYKELAFIKVG